jgi:hypothetical protein
MLYSILRCRIPLCYENCNAGAREHRQCDATLGEEQPVRRVGIDDALDLGRLLVCERDRQPGHRGRVTFSSVVLRVVPFGDEFLNVGLIPRVTADSHEAVLLAEGTPSDSAPSGKYPRRCVLGPVITHIVKDLLEPVTVDGDMDSEAQSVRFELLPIRRQHGVKSVQAPGEVVDVVLLGPLCIGYPDLRTSEGALNDGADAGVVSPTSLTNQKTTKVEGIVYADSTHRLFFTKRRITLAVCDDCIAIMGVSLRVTFAPPPGLAAIIAVGCDVVGQARGVGLVLRLILLGLAAQFWA